MVVICLARRLFRDQHAAGAASRRRRHGRCRRRIVQCEPYLVPVRPAFFPNTAHNSGVSASTSRFECFAVHSEVCHRVSLISSIHRESFGAMLDRKLE